MKNITLFFTLLLSIACLLVGCSNNEKKQMVELLKTDVSEWNKYVAEQREVDSSWTADLKNVDLSGLDLSGANLERVNLEGANLEKSNLKDVDLSHSNLKHVNIGGVNFENTNLKGTIYAYLNF